jgi:alanyl-tRNA synthetase
MKKMSSNEIRNMYLKFFEEKGHLIVPSASLIPINDPTLLWINAGVTPLKKYFDGSSVPENKRLTSAQKCIRTNDIDNVGRTARHHTFFEMLGNFSIGDYFKKEAIAYSFELLTSEKYFGLDKDKLYMTIYTDDDDAYNYWVKEGVDPSHIIRLEGNFWEIGEGPSGPDSEIFYDRGEEFDPEHKGITLLKEEIDNDRYIEIWNNVFSMYNAKVGVDRKDYRELPSKNIDTGMGLERIVSIIQGTKTNFETDLFMPIIDSVSKICGKPYNGEMAFKVIADHVKTLTFAISDGATFSNEGRGYVLRRLLRRAVRYGKKIGINEPFMYKLVPIVVSIMGDYYTNLYDKKGLVSNLILREEELFGKTLTSGEQKLEEIIESANSKVISGVDAFKLYDTYGFPCELTMEYLEEKGYTIDKEEFDKCMLKQKEMARSARSKEESMNTQSEVLLNFKEESSFVGYDAFNCTAKVIGLIKDDKLVDTLDNTGYVVLDKTPFYAEMGGQVADTGIISGKDFKMEIDNVIKAPHKQHLHFGKVDGTIKLGDEVTAKINVTRREDIAKNHSATHLLQEALKEALNAEVMQAGSKVDANNLRFDFTYQGKITDQEMILAEHLVNDKIATKTDSKTEIMGVEDAKKKGAVALFEEKYESTVRVVTLYDSIELCGGTHVKNVGDIKKFAIKSFESKGSNVYRIEATTDKYVESELYSVIDPYNDEMIKLLSKAKRVIHEAHNDNINLDFKFDINNDAPISYADIVYNRQEVANVREQVKELEKAYEIAKSEKALEDLSSFDKDIVEFNDFKYIITKTNGYEVSFLKQLVDRLLEKIGIGFVFVANINNNNVNFIAKAHNDLSNRVDIGAMIKDASIKSSGNGGGSKLFGQGGGTDISNLDSIISDVKTKLN